MIQKIISLIKKSKREKMTTKHGKFKKIVESDRGYILVLSLVILMTLTVIAVGYVTNVTLETSIVSNYVKNRDTLNAAEAGLEVAMLITHEEIITQLEPFSGTERVMSLADNVTTYTYSFQPLFDDGTGIKVKYRIIPENPDPQKNRFLYRTYTSCQEIIHFAYPYAIEVVAETTNETGREYLKRQIRILETPLVQYFVFFDDDFTWHPGPVANAWGRIHTNGNIWFRPQQDIWIRNYSDPGNERVPHFITASGTIKDNNVFNMGPTAGPGRTRLKIHDLDIIGTENQCEATYDLTPPYARNNNCDYVYINTDIDSTNAEVQMDRFTDENDCTYLIVGVPKSPTIRFNALFRESFYERRAKGPSRSEYFGIAIVIEYPTINNWPPRNIADHTGVLHIYAATKDFAHDFASFTDGIKMEDVTEAVFMAGDGVNLETETDAGDGTIVFSPETVYNPFGGAGFQFPDNDMNTAIASLTGDGYGGHYPVYLERNDMRQRMNGVALTTVNVEKLEEWFFEHYLDEQYDGVKNDQSIDDFLVDPLTGDPTKLLIFVSRTPTVDETSALAWGASYNTTTGPPNPYYDDHVNQVLQAIKLWRTTELICATTFVSDNPIYVQGDVNTIERKGFAVIGDDTSVLSNDWDDDWRGTGGTANAFNDPSPSEGGYRGQTGGRPPANNNLSIIYATTGVGTQFNIAFFGGRDDLNTYTSRGGTNSRYPGGLHNWLPKLENWRSREEHVMGCMISLWSTKQAQGPYTCGNWDFPDWFTDTSMGCCVTSPDCTYGAPRRFYGWDPGFLDPSYWPPYCPSAYGVERVGWLEGEDYLEDFIQSPKD